MAVRRRSRSRRPLTELARRSPLHAVGVWLLKSALTVTTFLAAWKLIADWAVPSIVDGMGR